MALNCPAQKLSSEGSENGWYTVNDEKIFSAQGFQDKVENRPCQSKNLVKSNLLLSKFKIACHHATL